MPEPFIPTTDIQDRLDVYLNRHGPAGPAIYRWLLVMLIAGLLALPLIRVSLTVAAPGVLRPAIERHEVRVSSGGRVARLHVTVGQAVQRGDSLVTFAAEPLLSRQHALHARIAEGERLAADLRAVLAMATGEEVRAIETGEVRAEWARLDAERAERRIAMLGAEREVLRALPLTTRGLLPRAEMENAQVRLDAERAADALAVAGQLAAWRTRLGDLEAEVVQLRAEAAEVSERIEQATVVSPVAGTVEELLAISPGSFVGAGELLGVVSPSAGLLAEAWLSPADVGAVRPGLPARVHVDAFNFSDWGMIAGTVESISDDYIAVNGRPSFRVSIRLDDPRLLAEGGRTARLRKGMTVRTHFVLAERSLFQLLRDRAADWFDPRLDSEAVS